MPVLSVRVSDEEKEAWVEEAGGSRKLSEWIRLRCNAKPVVWIENARTMTPVLTERGKTTALVQVDSRSVKPSESVSPRSASARDFTPDFKQPGQKKKAR